MLMSNPSNLEAIRQRFPGLANAIQKNDTGKCRILFLNLAKIRFKLLI